MVSSRREFLKLAGVGVAALALGSAAGFIAGSSRAERRSSEETTTPTGPQAPKQEPKRVRALFVYVGPIGDYGWTHAHHVGREKVEKALAGYVETRYLEKVAEDQAYQAIKQALESEKFDAVFATSFGFIDAVKRLAREYPDVKFYHCSGPWEEFRDLPNVVTYFAEFYQLYYLNGIAAGAVTNTCNVGYVPAFLIPEVVRHINAFALGAVHGAKLMGKCGSGEKVSIYVTPPLRSWFDPNRAKQYAESLITRHNVDVIAYTEDSTAILEAAAEYGVYSFSHYSNMLEYFTKGAGASSEVASKVVKSHLTGQVADWSPIYTYLLAKLVAGVFEKEDIWARIGDFTPIRWRRSVENSTAGQPEGAVYLAPINTEAIPARAVEEIKKLYEDMKELVFEPFTGPIRGYEIDPASGKQVGDVEVKVPEGTRWGRNELWSPSTMNWFYEKIVTLG
ncbi:MAG: BMP family ABC transporter substrate-binding protein [Thermoproteota archaeon]